jgi:predicted nucleic acid-binding Zn ribbon protein
MSIHCTQCGSELPNDAKFCLQCGKPLEYSARFIYQPESQMGCFGLWLIALVWSPAIGFGISVIVAFVGGFKSNKPVLGILVGIGCLAVCIITGWLASKVTPHIMENVHF